MVGDCTEAQDEIEAEVPTPDVVWRAATINDTFSAREQIKADDFILSGSEREATSGGRYRTIATREADLEILNQALAQHEADYAQQLEQRIAPLKAKLATLSGQNRELRSVAKAAQQRQPLNSRHRQGC